MLSAEQFIGFLLAASALTIAPGPDNLMVLSLGMSQGRRQGMAFGLGCAAGCLSHTLLAVIGVSAVIAASPAAFTLLKLFGGAYLVWLGFNALRHAGVAHIAAAGERRTPWRLFLKGIVANAVNPKVILFFLSFLPQFVVAENGPISVQMAWLGVVFAGQSAVIFGLLGYFSGTVGQWLKSRPGLGLSMDRLAGLVFIGLGLRLVVH